MQDHVAKGPDDDHGLGLRAMRWLLGLTCAALLVGCSDPATFRPAKGVKDFPAAKDAYLVHEPLDGCIELGYVIKARRRDDIATTAANHGGTHYQILDHSVATSLETDTTAHQAFGTVYAHSSSYTAHYHSFIARVYRC